MRSSDEEADALFDTLTEKEIVWETYLRTDAMAKSVRTIEVIMLVWTSFTAVVFVLSIIGFVAR